MSRKTLYRCAVSILLVLSLTVAKSAYAKDHAARLKESIQTDPLYLSTTVYELNSSMSSSKDNFKKTFDNRYVVLSGDLKVDSVGKNSKSIDIVDKDGNKCTLDTTDSAVKTVVNSLSSGAEVTVYGQVNIKGITGDSYEISAKEILKESKPQFTPGEYFYYPDVDYTVKTVDDLSTPGKIKYYIPTSWASSFVAGELTNNGVKGYQYYLNAISPQSLDYPEIFSIFWFNYETYLEKVPTNPTDGDNKDIEEAIVRNILDNLDESIKVKIETFKDPSGTRIDYCTTTYRPLDGRDYRLEFMFRPAGKGIVCMLYLYYPSDEAVNHVREAAYVVETMELE